MGNRMDAVDIAQTGLEWISKMPVYNDTADRLLKAVRIKAHEAFIV